MKSLFFLFFILSTLFFLSCSKDSNPSNASNHKSGDIIARAGNYNLSISGDNISWIPPEEVEELIIHPDNQIGKDLGTIDNIRIWQLHIAPNAASGIPTPIKIGHVPSWVTQSIPPPITQLQPLQAGKIYTITIIARFVKGGGQIAFVK